MKVSVEEFLGKDIKLVIMETFQEFLLKQSECKNEKTEAATKKPKIAETKKTVEPVAKKQADKSKEPIKKTENLSQSNKSEKPNTAKNSSSPVKSSSKSAQIEKLKSYVFKCGVRKNW